MLSNSSNTGNKNLTEKDRQYIWHPFTPIPSEKQVVISSASGVWLYTEDGARLLDGISSWWVNLFGHSNKYIAAAIAEQAILLEHVIFAGFSHEPAIRLAERLAHILPGNPSKIFFSDNGSTAIEVSLKMGLQYWYNKDKSKKRIVALEGAYHGDTFGAMSIGGRGLFSRPFEQHLFQVDFIPFPSNENIQKAEAELRRLCESGDVAIFIFEPLVQGTAGMRTYPVENLELLIKIAKEYDVILIADEVFTGFGRTGKWFACNYLKTQPDLVCVSKGITGGFLPLGITACNPAIEEAFVNTPKEKTFYHGHSYTGNPLACAAANASLDLLLAPSTAANISRIEKKHRNFISSIKGHSRICRVDLLGTILSIEFTVEGEAGYASSIRDYLYEYFLERNILLRPLGNVIYILPAYIISDDELELIYQSIQNLLKTL